MDIIESCNRFGIERRGRRPKALSARSGGLVYDDRSCLSLRYVQKAMTRANQIKAILKHNLAEFIIGKEL